MVPPGIASGAKWLARYLWTHQQDVAIHMFTMYIIYFVAGSKEKS